MKCAICGKKLEYVEEEDTPDGISQSFGCKHCVAIITITRINNKQCAEDYGMKWKGGK